ncbi:ferric reductase transmembrane component [Phaeosphaeriaceae sp. PMI808]|nr:ferric reductase transmembrane component [Phaeosphaeriaceae sp. PMI808]
MDAAPWLRDLLRFALEATASSQVPWHRNNTLGSITQGGDLLDPDDPGKDPRFRKLVEAILWGRKFLKTYNAVLVCILLIFSTWHGIDTILLNRRRCRMCNNFSPETRGGEILSANDTEASSSSSSTIHGDATPPNATSHKVTEVNETSPLLSTSRSHSRASWVWRPYYVLRSILQYQPPSIPIINKTLPTNAITLFVIAWTGLIIFYNFCNMPLSFMYLFVFADRCGIIFISNLPLLYLLAAKNQPIKLLTGHSYESLNIFHRRVGEVMCFEALLHFIGMFAVWYGMLRRLGFTLTKFIFNRVVLLGLPAFTSYQVIYLTSLGSFRKRCYEIFLATHVILQVVGLVFLWFHHYTSRPYVGISLAIFLIDRLVYRLWTKSSTHTATLTILEDDETVLLSSNWETSDRSSKHTSEQSLLTFLFTKLKDALTPKNMTNGWKPTQHVFIAVPALSRKHVFQSHPFTIFSAAPLTTMYTPPTTTKHTQHAWFTLLIRSQAPSGFSHSLLTHARQYTTTSIRLDGPYGSLHTPHKLEASNAVIVIAGGSGIALAYPLLYTLAHPPHAFLRAVKFLWITHDPLHRLWLPVDKMKELEDWGIEVFCPPPTVLAGRPDVKEIIGVVVSGPVGLIRGGRDVWVGVEKFGW